MAFRTSTCGGAGVAHGGSAGRKAHWGNRIGVDFDRHERGLVLSMIVGSYAEKPEEENSVREARASRAGFPNRSLGSRRIRGIHQTLRRISIHSVQRPGLVFRCNAGHVKEIGLWILDG